MTHVQMCPLKIVSCIDIKAGVYVNLINYQHFVLKWKDWKIFQVRLDHLSNVVYIGSLRPAYLLTGFFSLRKALTL